MKKTCPDCIGRGVTYPTQYPENCYRCGGLGEVTVGGPADPDAKSMPRALCEVLANWEMEAERYERDARTLYQQAEDCIDKLTLSGEYHASAEEYEDKAHLLHERIEAVRAALRESATDEHR